MLAPLVQLKTNQRISLVGIYNLRKICLCQAILQLDSFLELSHKLPIGLTQNSGEVGLRHLILRVHQTVSQLAVIGENKQTFGIGVEAAYVKKTLASSNLFRNHVAYARAAQVIRHSGLHAARLVEHKIFVLLVDINAHTIYSDDVNRGVYLNALLGNDLAVDLNTAGIDEDFSVATRSNACLSEHLLETFPLRLVFIDQPIGAQFSGYGFCSSLLLFL